MEFKTQTIKGGGKRPTFNETFEIEVYRLSDEIKFACFDEDIQIDDIVGEKSLPVCNLCQAKLVKKVVPLEYDGARSGDLVIETKFTPKGAKHSRAKQDQTLRQITSNAKVPDVPRQQTLKVPYEEVPPRQPTLKV